MPWPWVERDLQAISKDMHLYMHAPRNATTLSVSITSKKWKLCAYLYQLLILVRVRSYDAKGCSYLCFPQASGGSTASTESPTDAFTRSNALVSTVTRTPQLMQRVLSPPVPTLSTQCLYEAFVRLNWRCWVRLIHRFYRCLLSLRRKPKAIPLW